MHEVNFFLKVQFSLALQKAVTKVGFHAVIEVGPHPALAGPIRYREELYIGAFINFLTDNL